MNATHSSNGYIYTTERPVLVCVQGQGHGPRVLLTVRREHRDTAAEMGRGGRGGGGGERQIEKRKGNKSDK